ncbi:AAA family ATPase, partial [Butyricicoccus intestinisimiae]|uniref:AAA family ATPase n=1 Tax=Butyricicoccus intestinisimiae TaxID=2841509 RepID=UPI003D90CBB0
MVTINDISSLKIKGANFQDETILELFKKKISLIYGENGAGKSTIARGIYNWANQDD